MAQLYGPPSDGSIIPHILEDAIAEDVGNGASPIGRALRAVGVGPRGGSVIDPLMTALDTRDPRPLVVAQASDSTGDTAAEWFEIAWRELLAQRWAERPARVQRWDKTTDTYGALTTWQSGALAEVAGSTALARDTFSTDKADLNGTTDETGKTWAVTGTSVISVSGGHAIQEAAGSSIAAITLAAHDSLDGTLAHSYRVTATTANQQTQLIYSSSAVNGGNRLQLVITGTTTTTITLQQVIAGVNTTLASWPSELITYSGVEQTVDVSVTVDGTTVTATVNGDTRTATIDPTQFGRAYTYFTMANAQGMRVDSFERLAATTTTDGSSSLGYLTAYNGAYAGGTLQTNLDRLDAMYPAAPDVLFINHGHNYTGTYTPDVFAQTFVDFVAAFRVKWPGTPIVVLSQNPKFEIDTRPAVAVEEHAARQRRLRSLCKAQGWGYIPGFEAFSALIDGGKSLIQADGVHPITGDAAGTGSRLQADTAKAWIAAESLRP